MVGNFTISLSTMGRKKNKQKTHQAIEHCKPNGPNTLVWNIPPNTAKCTAFKDHMENSPGQTIFKP